MVDWAEVDRLRSKGSDWDRIAEDAKVNFHADASVRDPGRALRALYYQRKSRQQRRPASQAKSGKDDAEAPKERKWTIARVGWLTTPLFGIWFLLALALPSPVGVYLPAIPVLGILLAIGAFLLAFGLLRSAKKWTPVYKNSLATGIVLGLVIAGGFGLAAVLNGCGVLPSATTAISEPAGWKKVSASPWQENGAPIFYFYGAAGCPFCSASSWAMAMALERFGTLTGTSYDHSSPTDSPPSIPEIVLASASLQSSYVALKVTESTDDTSVVFPGTSECIQQAYLSAYSGGSIPFVVINGEYYHAGVSIVDPTALQGLTPSEVQQQITNQSGPAWTAISPQAFWIMAFLLKADGGRPTSVAQDPNVAPLLSQIS